MDNEDGIEGQYAPSPAGWVRDQVDLYESSGGTDGTTLRETGLPVIVVTMRGRKSGAIRKVPLMRVEHGNEYALVASMGGAPTHPVWYLNLMADMSGISIQDETESFDVDIREVFDEEKAAWWERSIAAFPPYVEYQAKTDRVIPVLVATRRG